MKFILTENYAILEESMQSQDDEIYVVLSSGRFGLARLIKWFTSSKYHHMSLAFDLEKNLTMYSMRLQTNGLSEEKIEMFSERGFDIAIWSFKVGRENKIKARETVEDMLNKNIKYSSKTLVTYVVKSLLKLKGKFINPDVNKEEFICSEFVALILNVSGVPTMDLPGIPTPNDLFKLKNRKFLFRGKANNFIKLLKSYQNRILQR